jgi:AAA domain
MPNAKDARVNEESPARFLLTGVTGSGKTTQFLTLPGKKFVYIFDPNALSSLEGYDIDYEQFVADLSDVDIAVKTLSSQRPSDTTSRKISPRAYVQWETHFEKHWDTGFFDTYSWIGFDSFTLFAEAVMDRVLFLNGRTGKQPEQADWAAQVNTIGNVFRVFSNSKTGIFCTAHLDERQDDVNKRIFWRPMMTGRLRVRIPLLFNHVFVAHAEGNEKGTTYTIQTTPDRSFPIVRTAWADRLPMYQDVTIADFNRADQYGLGAMLKNIGRPRVQPKLVTSSKRR